MFTNRLYTSHTHKDTHFVSTVMQIFPDIYF